MHRVPAHAYYERRKSEHDVARRREAFAISWRTNEADSKTNFTLPPGVKETGVQLFRSCYWLTKEVECRALYTALLVSVQFINCWPEVRLIYWYERTSVVKSYAWVGNHLTTTIFLVSLYTTAGFLTMFSWGLLTYLGTLKYFE